VILKFLAEPLRTFWYRNWICPTSLLMCLLTWSML
jgi:hypothetical protein